MHTAHLVTAALFGIVALTSSSTIDIPMHDVYFVISVSQIFTILTSAFAVFFLVSFLMYKLDKPMRTKLGLAHWILSVIGIVVLIYIIWNAINGESKYYDYSVMNTNQIAYESEFQSNLLYLIALSVLTAQVLFLINIVVSLTKPK